MLTLAPGLYTDFGMYKFEPITCYNYITLRHIFFLNEGKTYSIFLSFPGQIKGLTVIHRGISTVLL